MNKSEFVELVKTSGEFSTLVEAEKALSAVITALGSAFEKGEDVQFQGFGTFHVKERPAKEGRNPKTGARVQIAATKTVSFKLGKSLKEKMKM